MTEEETERYSERIEALWDKHACERDSLEQQAQDGIARDLDGLHGVHGDVIAFIEDRWLRWLDAGIERLNREFKDKARTVARDFGEEWI